MSFTIIEKEQLDIIVLRAIVEFVNFINFFIQKINIVDFVNFVLNIL